MRAIFVRISTRSSECLFPLPSGAQVPIELLAKVHYQTGPPDIRSENGQPVGFVYVDPTTSDINGYVRAASERIAQQVKFPTGYSMQWGGQFQYLQQAEARLKFVVPLTLALIFVLLYLNTRSVTKTLIVLLAVPFSLVGAFWLLYLLGYNMSVAVWVGLIALAGLGCRNRRRDAHVFGSRVGQIPSCRTPKDGKGCGNGNS